MRLYVQICDPYGVILWQAIAPVTESLAAMTTPAGRAELRALVPGNYVRALETQMGCEVRVSVLP